MTPEQQYFRAPGLDGAIKPLYRRMTYQAIADKLGVPLSTVYYRVLRMIRNGEIDPRPRYERIK
jgi:transposase